LFSILAASGTLTRGQNAADSFNPDVNGAVRAVVFTADGSCLIGGDFTTVGGTARSRIARVLPDGSLDAAFNPGANGRVNALAIQADGRILVGGQFTQAGGRLRTNLARLHVDGSTDESFSPAAAGGAVLALAVQPDGRILAGGQFTSLAGAARQALGRLHAEGTPDAGFDAALNGEVRSLAVLRDGRIAAGGTFTASGGTAAHGLVRLLQDGRQDADFATAAGTAVHAVAAWPDGSICTAMTAGAVNQVVLYPLAGPAQTIAVAGPVFSLAMQADGRVLAAGNFTAAGGQARSNLFRFTRSGALDTLATAASAEVLCTAQQPDGKIVAGGNFTTIGARSRNRLARMYADGRMDTSFNPGSNAFELGGNGGVALVAQQPDGLLLAGGFQHMLAGEVRIGMGRLFADGELDMPFNPSAGPEAEDPDTNCAIVQEDGRIVVGGRFSQLGGLTRQNLARINANGTGDATFTANVSMAGTWSRVAALAVQRDGKILVGGRFNMIGSTARSFLARLNANGSVDTAFNPNVSEMVETIVVQDDGKIVIGGGFGTVGGVARASIARLHPDGTLDTAFTASADSAVYSLAVQPDGKILVGGYFDRLSGALKYRLGRLHANGTLDTTFDAPPGGDFPRIFSISVQANGMIIVSGTFTSLKGSARNQIARLFPNGTLDTAWNPNAGSSGYVPTVGLLDDGKCIAGGNYSNIGGQARRNIARLSNRYAALQALSLDAAGTTVRWLRGGGAPEVFQTTFDVSTDGVNFTRLGFAERSPGGWQLTGAALPASGSFLLRARARVIGGSQSACSGLIESLRLVHREQEMSVRSGTQEFSSAQSQSLEFGTVRTGQPAEREVVLTNSGNAPLTISGYTPVPGYEVLDFPAAGFTLQGGESRPIRLRLAAVLPGTFNGSLNVQSNDGDEAAFNLPVAGTVITPEIVVTETSAGAVSDGAGMPIAFGTTRQGTPVSRTFTIANTGTAPLLVRGLTAPDGFARLNPPAFPLAVALGETISFSLSLTATASGDFAGSVVIDNDDDDESLFDFPVTGRVITPEIALHAGADTSAPEISSGQSAPVSFGRVIQASPAVQPVVIANPGTAPLRVESVSVPSGFATAGLPALPFLIEPGATGGFEIRLTTTVPGTYTGNVVIRSDDLDEADFTFPLAGEIYIPEPVAGMVASSTNLNRQTGLREQSLTVSNATAATVPAYHILIRGLPAGVQVHNASTVRDDGTAVVTIYQTMPPFSQQQIVIEYYSATRQPVEITPQLSTEVILNPTVPPAGAGPSFEIDRLQRMAGGEMLLEFTSQPGQFYAVEYSADGTVWHRSPLRIRAAGNRVQWIDRGPPQTHTTPATESTRLYRIREITP